jgi:hypothetical protein
LNESENKNISQSLMKTGKAVLVNEVENLAVIDIDFINEDSGNILPKLSEEDIVVRTASGGLHIYCNLGDFQPRKNRMIRCFKSPEFNIDLLSSINYERRNIVVLPESKGRLNHTTKVFSYNFICGGFNSVVERTIEEILADLGIDVNQLKTQRRRDKDVRDSKIEDNENEPNIDLLEDFSINDIIGKALDGEYSDDDNALINDLLRVVAFIPVAQLYIVKDNNPINDSFHITYKSKKAFMNILEFIKVRKINHSKLNELSEECSYEVNSSARGICNVSKWITAWTLFDSEYASRFMKKGIKFYRSDSDIISIWRGYNFPLVNEIETV